MKTVTIARWLILLACGVVLLAADAVVPAPTPTQPPALGRQAWFLDLLKRLADADGLHDPHKVGAILGVRFARTVETRQASHMEHFAKAFERDEYTLESPSWFVSGAPGYASTGNWRPDGGNGFAAGVDPVAKGAAVNFKYFQSKRFGLLDKNALFSDDLVDADSQVSLIFYGVDKLACVTMKDVQTRFPGLVHMNSTDASAERYLYYAKPYEDAGAVLSFGAPVGQCISEATIEAFSAFGKHDLRAKFKWVACQRHAARAFCARDPSRTREEFRAYEPFHAMLRQRCGALNAYNEREPRSNAEPPGTLNDAYSPMGCPYPD